MSIMIVDGEEVEMASADIAELEETRTTALAEAKDIIAFHPLTIGDFIARFVIPDEEEIFSELDERMRSASLLVRRQWASDRTEIVEGTGFYNVLSSSLDGLVTPERKAELLARVDFKKSDANVL